MNGIESSGDLRARVRPTQAEEPALMSLSIAEARAAIQALGIHVGELLGSLSPVCCPINEVAVRCSSGAIEPSGPPISPIREQFEYLKAQANLISEHIASVRRTIEI